MSTESHSLMCFLPKSGLVHNRHHTLLTPRIALTVQMARLAGWTGRQPPQLTMCVPPLTPGVLEALDTSCLHVHRLGIIDCCYS